MILPAIIAFNILAPILIPGMFFKAAIAVFAAILTVPTSIMELKNFFACYSFLIP